MADEPTEEQVSEQELREFIEAERKHVEKVRHYLMVAAALLMSRASVHDASKFMEPELSGFAKMLPKLKVTEYGSPEYKALLDELQETLKHHYAMNPHHPEHYDGTVWYHFACGGVFTSDEAPECELLEPKADGTRSRPCPVCRLGLAGESFLDPYPGINGMNLFDLIEMFFDWWAATEKHETGDIRKSIEHNEDRFGLTPQLARIFLNTVKSFGHLRDLGRKGGPGSVVLEKPDLEQLAKLGNIPPPNPMPENRNRKGARGWTKRRPSCYTGRRTT